MPCISLNAHHPTVDHSLRRSHLNSRSQFLDWRLTRALTGPTAEERNVGMRFPRPSGPGIKLSPGQAQTLPIMAWREVMGGERGPSVLPCCGADRWRNKTRWSIVTTSSTGRRDNEFYINRSQQTQHRVILFFTELHWDTVEKYYPILIVFPSSDGGTELNPTILKIFHLSQSVTHWRTTNCCNC